ncbi:hypothetical protein N4T20_10295 [Flavobacterium sp. TR2]|nr:hypothetical protein [Flavobacterium sp. TR2]UWY30305.1 hypothetical protein N4T20_10295 [Flavobacterium sp. TR2]
MRDVEQEALVKVIIVSQNANLFGVTYMVLNLDLENDIKKITVNYY